MRPDWQRLEERIREIIRAVAEDEMTPAQGILRIDAAMELELGIGTALKEGQAERLCDNADTVYQAEWDVWSAKYRPLRFRARTSEGIDP